MSTRTPSLGLLVVVVVLLLAVATARGDRVVLRNGSSLLGKIVGEDRSEIQLELEDGMRMAIRRSQIERIEREDAPEPESEPETEPETGGGTEPNAPTRPATAPEPGNPAAPAFFERSPGIAWDLDYGRYPTVLAAKLSRFRAYDLAEMNPLAASPTDGRFAPLVREHGHGGFLAAWTFRYVGMEDIRFGDQVKFVGELTSPDDPEMCLLRLQAGPSPTASRLSVILIRRDAETLRFVTPDTFDGTDFKQRDLVDLPNRALPVRTFDPTFRLITEQWVLPARSAIFSGIGAPFGETPLVKMERYRFRLDWFATPPGERPPLDPSLLARDVIRPLAMPGRPVATDMQVRTHWGTPEINRGRLNAVVEGNRKALSGFGIQPGADYYVEEDRVGTLGAKGISLETRRYYIDRATIERLTTP